MKRREDIQEGVKRVVRDVFESMYFMFPEAIEEGDPAPPLPESCFKAGVGVKNGSEVFVLYASDKLVMDMAKSLFGTDQPVEEADLVDTFREAANIIGGNLVTALELDNSVGLDVPDAERLQTCSELAIAQGAVFDIDSAFFKVTVMEPSGLQGTNKE